MSMAPLKPPWRRIADDVGPVAVAEARRAVEGELVRAGDAVLADHVPVDRRVLAVHVEDLLDPLAQLRHRVDQLDHLVAGLPLQADVVRVGTALNIISQAVGVWAMFQSPVFQLPPMSQFSKAMPHALVGRALGQRPEDLLVAPSCCRGCGLSDEPAGEAAHHVAAEQRRRVDELLPAVAGLAWPCRRPSAGCRRRSGC